MKDVEILWHIPSLEDLFQVAMDKWYSPAFYYDEEYSKYIVSFERKIADRQFTQDDFPYNPILPLLDQPNLEEIISLFK